MNFCDALISTYCENPCQVLPNALWKTLAQFENLETSFCIENLRVTQIQAWQGKSLFIYWSRNREPLPDASHRQIDLDLALIHQDYLHTFPSQQFAIHTPYFRLIHRPNEVESKAPVPVVFRIAQVKNIQQESVEIAYLIGQCYQDMHPSAETIINWSRYPTFDPSLWIWVIDKEREIPVGLGIAEIDTSILEGSLEWIQVLPAYRGLGLGRIIVRELLSRLEKRVTFTTVAGERENKTNPEVLYRSCGFEGHDIWWMLSKS